MGPIITEYVRSCPDCQKRKTTNHHTKSPITAYKTPGAPFEVCQVDLVGPLPISPQGYSYVLTAVDMFSKYLISIPLANKDTITIASSLTKYGVCNTLISDRGTEFTSACMAEVCRQLCISQEFTPSYVHHCLGACERSHGTLEERLSSYVNKNSNNWVDFLSSNTFSIDQSVNKGNNKITELRTILQIRVKTKLPNSEQSYKGKVKTHKYTNRQNQSTTGKLWKP